MPMSLLIVADIAAVAVISYWEPLGSMDNAFLQSNPHTGLMFLLLTYAIRFLAIVGVLLFSAAVYMTENFA